jgi:hypothetical protein
MIKNADYGGIPDVPACPSCVQRYGMDTAEQQAATRAEFEAEKERIIREQRVF